MRIPIPVFVCEVLDDAADMWSDGIMGKLATLLLLACFAAVAFTGFILCDMLMSRSSDPFEATVIERVYESERATTGTAVGPKGELLITSSTEPERWKAIVNIEGTVVSAACWPAGWATIKNGTKVQCRYAKGRFTGWNYGWSVTAIY